MIDGGEFFIKDTEGVALSGKTDLIRTDLWRDQQWSRRGKTGAFSRPLNLSGKRTEYKAV